MAASRGGTLLIGTRFRRASADADVLGEAAVELVAEGRSVAADVRVPPGAGRVGARLADAEPQTKTEEGTEAAREEGQPGADRPEARGCADHADAPTMMRSPNPSMSEPAGICMRA